MEFIYRKFTNFKEQFAFYVDFSNNQLSGEIDLSYMTITNLYLSSNQFKKFPKSFPLNINGFYFSNNPLNRHITYLIQSHLLIYLVTILLVRSRIGQIWYF
eukprot:NODE_1432_length_1074_cov_0.322051.p2 type:complete len:101 gc:universal NODE_1432_length_1074_cov_0.322051:665-363(-)